MSAIGPKRTCASALQMSASGGKADKLCGPLTHRRDLYLEQVFWRVRGAVILKVM